MTELEIVVDNLKKNGEMLSSHLADFSEADMFVRPCPGANHTTWQLGHLIRSEAFMTSLTTGGAPALPAGFADKFTKSTAGNDDPKFFPTKAELLAQLDTTRKATIDWASGLTTEQRNQPTPDFLHAFAGTFGQLATVIPYHVNMHVGQIQVIRRKLGKPVLF